MVKTIQIPSLCIPRDTTSLTKIHLNKFSASCWLVEGKSCIERIDLVSRVDRNTSEPFYVAFLHFRSWCAIYEGTCHFRSHRSWWRSQDRVFAPMVLEGSKEQRQATGRSAGPRMLLSEEDVEEIKSHQKAFREKRDGPEAEAWWMMVRTNENTQKTENKKQKKGVKIPNKSGCPSGLRGLT